MFLPLLPVFLLYSAFQAFIYDGTCIFVLRSFACTNWFSTLLPVRGCFRMSGELYWCVKLHSSKVLGQLGPNYLLQPPNEQGVRSGVSWALSKCPRFNNGQIKSQTSLQWPLNKTGYFRAPGWTRIPIILTARSKYCISGHLNRSPDKNPFPISGPPMNKDPGYDLEAPD